MNIMHLFFSFDGRIRRLHYWLGGIGFGIVAWIAIVILAAVTGAGAGMMAGNGAVNGLGGGSAVIGGLLILLVLVAMVWASFALQVKRWHDRDKTWSWIFINFIPIIGWVWALIEVGFSDGTPGPNKYGPSPKGLIGPEAMPS